MKFPPSVWFAAVATAAFSLSVGAYSIGTGPEPKPGAQPMDCAKAKDKARCEVLNKDIAACKDKVGDDWRECMHRPAPAVKVPPPKPRDCAKARNKERCEGHNAALEACKDKETRAEHRKCMAGQLPAPIDKKS